MRCSRFGIRNNVGGVERCFLDCWQDKSAFVVGTG